MGGVDIYIYPRIIDLGINWRRVISFTLRENPPVPIGWEADWAPRIGLDDVERRLELRPLGLPARGQPLYRLRYLGSPYITSSLVDA
jgi:hypothetical protein